ncbi:RNA-directed DNA polymerase from mobile element jockey-like [Rhizophagus irregularis DAOM 181602=DAOM 197198]|nr:RNA-directed DNA polymerase from mobile element jockey-like [Rhizophagus irregularis DAOM 181602=DAOM 197198]
MSSPPAPSVINPDIPPPPRPITSTPSGDRPLSPTTTTGAPNKRSRIVTDDAMNVDITLPSAPAPTLTSSVPSGLPVNKVQVITSPHTTTTPVETVDASIHAPSNTDGKGKAVAFDIPERQPSPDGNAAAIKFAPSRYHAVAYLRDAPDAFKAKFTTNRSMCDEVDCSLFRYSSYGAHARCDGSGDNKKILVFFNDQHDYTDCVSSPHADLLNLAFMHYSPADAKLNDEAKSLFVTDIPLFLTETQVRQAFSRYGTVIKCKLTPRNHYYNRHIQFSSTDAITQFNDIWAIICLGNSLRVCPASFSKSQRDSRREHVAILAGIPKNIKEADLLEIATQVNAKALNVPLSISSYKPKPYVYLNFSSFESLEAAKEMTVAFRGKGLTWHPPNEAQILCHVCGRPGCSPSNHNNSNTSRPNTPRNSNRTNNTNNNPRNNDNSSGSTQPPHRPHSIVSTTPTSSSDNPALTLPQHVIDELKAQIKEIANTLHTLKEIVSWMNDTITAHEYRLSELESMMNYDAPDDSKLHSPPNDHDHYNHSYDNGWDDAPIQDTNSGFNLPPHTSSSLMDISPDASFSALDPSSILSNRHVPLPVSRPINITPDANTSRLQSEIFNGFHPPNSALPNNNSFNNPSSPSLSSPLINFGQINVNGLCSPNEHSHYNFKSYWAPSPSNSRPHDGVGLLLRHPLHKHVQKIDPWKGHLLKLDLFFHQKKISIISVYIPPYHSIHYKERDAIFAQLNLWLDKARSNNYHVVILGDFNADELSHSHLPQHHLKILRSLSSRYFTDHQSHISSFSGPSPTFYHQNGSSRLDYIWSSPGFPAPGLFSHVESCPKLNDNPFTDHRVLITAFDFSSCFATLAKARLKQKSEQRTIFLYKNLNDDTWDKFSIEVNSRLELYLTTHHPSISSLSALSLDKLWYALKRSILGGAIDSLPFQHVSNTHHHKHPPELTMLIAINKFLDRLLFKLTTSRPSRPAQISQMINSLSTQLSLLKSLLKDYTIPNYSTTPLPAFIKFLRSQKTLVSAYLSTQFQQHRVDSIEYYTALRDEHFSTSPGSFISSALSVEHRSIVLDRVLVVIDSKPTLLTDPSDIKQAAINHFQSVVTPPLVQYSSMDSFPPRWQRAYTPLSDIDSSLYISVMSPILEDEWKNILNSMPNNKASGPSKISYEMLKHLTGEAFNLSLILANACLIHGDIPADWREALVYPISKPHEFDAQLKNTRPITLLETVRKCVVKVVTTRLSNILADNQVLQGGNFAGLPGGSTDIPIKMLDAIIHQRRFDKSDDQELWIVSQDISKAFDSIDLNMLRLALIRLHIPSLLIKFIINLFTRRNNKIITHYGDTSGYRVRIGIDQGEIISPLLWVIYLDSLLTTLNREACDPFILKSSALLDYSPTEYEQHNLPVSHITFMDDSTLIASSKRGIEDRLSITAEFYTLNNTQANSAKYILLSSERFSQLIMFDLSPSSLITTSTLTLKALALSKSFRFLGVWFCLSASSHFVHNQTTSMVKDMAALLSPKKLLAQHVAYLYNVVLLPRLEFRLQTTLFAESTINRMVSPMLSFIRQKAGLASVTPLSALFTLLPFSSQQAFGRFLSSHVASWQKIFSHPSYKPFANYMITYLQSFLDCDTCPSTINLEPWSHTFSLRTHSLFNSLLFFSRLNITWSLMFRPPRKDLCPAISLRSILPKDLFTSMKNVRKNFSTRFLAQLITPIPSSHTVASISFIDITLISHWIASSVDDLLSDFKACQGCASALPLIRYPTKPRTYIHADTRSVSLSASLGYAKSLLLFHLFAPDRLPSINEQMPRISDIQLPLSVYTLYIDGSFLPPSNHPVSSMAYAWTAIDSDGFILESHYNIISSIFPSALRSEVFALLHGLDSLPLNSKITVATDCAQLLSLWSSYVNAPFIPRMLKEFNHLLWSSIRVIKSHKNLDVTLIKVPAHADDTLNNHVDALAKAAHTDSHLSSRPSLELLAPCILLFNSLPVDMNIQKFIRDIFDAKTLLTLALLPRFNSSSSTSDIDWACTKFCLINDKQFRRKPHLYNPSWLCPQCNSFPETLDHLWTCPYILPEFSPLNTFKTLLLALRTNYLDKFLSASFLIPLPDSFAAEFIALDCWDCDPPSFSCLRLARGLIPLSLTEFLGIYFSSPTIWSILDTPLHDFHFDLYVQIWLCRSIFFHHWESAQGITKKMKLSALDPSSISRTSFNIPPDSSIPSLATFSLYLGFLFGNGSDLRVCWIVDSHWPSGKDGVCVSVIV